MKLPLTNMGVLSQPEVQLELRVYQANIQPFGTRSPPIVVQAKRRATKIRPKAVGSQATFSAVLRTSINADRKQLVTSSPVWLYIMSAVMSIIHLLNLG